MANASIEFNCNRCERSWLLNKKLLQDFKEYAPTSVCTICEEELCYVCSEWHTHEQEK